MADGKYGRLFTEDDVRSLFNTHEITGHSLEDLLDSGDFRFPKDEPLFLLRAQDQAALGTIQEYKMNLKSMWGAIKILDGVQSAIASFREFALQNPDRMKVPD